MSEPRCDRCGHTPGWHGATFCHLKAGCPPDIRQCDCPGWLHTVGDDTTGDVMNEDTGPYPQPQEFGEWPKGIEDVGFNMPDAEHVASMCQQIRAVAVDMAAVTDTKQAGITEAQMRRALKDATAWAEDGYSDVSRSYWAGIRDTLRVILGETTRPPLVSSDDAAAYTLLR